MTTFEARGMTLERVREHVWELPRTGDMRVPARVFASERLLEEISGDKTLDQLRNTTHLPGIVKYAICMPDGHQGYGFPVGGVGAMDAETGCISPGSVGYDINCLTGNSEVLLAHGRRDRIDNLRDRFEDETALVPAGEEMAHSAIQLFTETADKHIIEVETVAGDSVTMTPNHPVFTPGEALEAGDLESGMEVFVHPFEGLPNEVPPKFTVLDESDFEGEDPQLVRVLEERGLLPLTSTDDAFARLLKLVGYHTGDGSFSGRQTWFYGEPAALEQIRADIEALGFQPSRIYERERTHEIDGREFTRTEYSVKSGSNALRQILIRLGSPDGRKVASSFTTPPYLQRLPAWQRALYLSAFFGAELSGPAPVARMNFQAPAISHNRLVQQIDAGETFLTEIAEHLESIGIETYEIEEVNRTETQEGEVVRLRLGISAELDNLIRFFTRVGYRYANEKQRNGLIAAQYLKTKRAVIEEREEIATEAKTLADGGVPVSKIKCELDGVNERFIERSVYESRSGPPRPPADFPSFDDYCDGITVRDDGSISTEIATIRSAAPETVYDIGVSHEAHAFVANGFVVSNCGVRMVRTSLSYEELRGREQELVDALFDAIPTGLGGGGVLEGDANTVESILARGVDWAVEHGYATEDDRRHCEDEGRRPGADPDRISQKAKDRGKNQIGSLGSGNHFLEVQRVTDVYDEKTAAAFGLRPDQIVVLIHCGSRGLGHQTCNDYLRKIEKHHKGLLEQLPDRELAAAPAGSQLAEDYYAAMNAAINFAWVNRQLITHATREVFASVFGRSWEDLEMELLYDVAHNIAKKEVHDVDGEDRELYVHRKGATRAFPAGHPDVPRAYRDVGQPVIIPGSMGAGSYVLRGGEHSLELTFGSTAHGAGRLMSRTQAKDEYWGGDVQTALRTDQQIYVKAQSGATIAEEAPGVYKDVDEVVRVSDALGIGDKVARTFPVCNIKG